MSSFLPSFHFTGHLDNRLPTIFAGLSLTVAVFVVLTSQVGLYFWKASIHSRDPLWIKGIVIVIWVIQVLELALTCRMTVLAHGHDHDSMSEISMMMAKESLWEWAVYFGTSVTTECLVHAFFISRIYLLEINTAHKRISVVLCIILVLEGSFGVISMTPFILPRVTESRNVISPFGVWSIPVWLGLSILADVSIAGSIYYILKKSGPIVTIRLNMLIKRLIRFCIQTGLVTSIITGITVAIWIVSQLDTGHLFMSFPIGGIYAACLMANLIARESYLHHVQIDEDGECFRMATRSIVFALPKSGDFDTEMGESTLS